MPELRALEEAVAALDPSELAVFRCWFAEFDAAAWDRQLEADLTAGKLALLQDLACRCSRSCRLIGG